MKKSEKAKKLFIGTSGWSYDHWQGVFYPDDVKSSDYLEYYTTKFDCVELNSSFYHLPKPKTVDGWMKRTPDYFQFCPKMSRYITHQKRLHEIDEAVENFFEVINPMQEKSGPVLVQFPPGLEYNESRVHHFLDVLKDKHSDFRFAIEVRDESWLNDDFFKLLSDYNTALVIADSGDRYPYSDVVTSDFVYIRFHGREKLYASDYDKNMLKPYARSIEHWLKEDLDVWVFFNNDYEGHAVKNAEKLAEMLF